jgi:ribosomal-protein-alanine N-acetyltransferase
MGHPDLRLRRVTLADLPAVQEVEREAFTAGWPPTAFEREITSNGMARYILLERVAAAAVPDVIGFGGLWLMVDQAHIVTVAVHPAERRHGHGRLLVLGLVLLAQDAGMAEVTLEVRVSNEAARALYRGFGFHEVGLRKRYYSDNGEDAVIMTTENLDSPAFASYRERVVAELDTRFGPGTAALASAVAFEA